MYATRPTSSASRLLCTLPADSPMCVCRCLAGSRGREAGQDRHPAGHAGAKHQLRILIMMEAPLC